MVSISERKIQQPWLHLFVPLFETSSASNMTIDLMIKIKVVNFIQVCMIFIQSCSHLNVFFQDQPLNFICPEMLSIDTIDTILLPFCYRNKALFIKLYFLVFLLPLNHSLIPLNTAFCVINSIHMSFKIPIFSTLQP